MQISEDGMVISDEIRSLIATAPLAHLTTLNADGSPQVSVVWVGLDGDEFVSGHMGAWQKVKNVRRDSRVALSLQQSGGTSGMPGCVWEGTDHRGWCGRTP